MSLTKEQLTVLEAPFPVEDHEFNQGRVYIRERAICKRLEMVDPSWSITPPELSIREGQVIAIATMTVCGVTRGGVGMDKVNSNNTNESEKSAATDVLKRCARLFGVGRYLLDTPEYVKDHKSLANWLKKLNGDTADSEPEATPAPATAAAFAKSYGTQRIGRNPEAVAANEQKLAEQGFKPGKSPLAQQTGPELDEYINQDGTPVDQTEHEPTATVEIRRTKKGVLTPVVNNVWIFKKGVLGELFGQEVLQELNMTAEGEYMLPHPVILTTRKNDKGYDDFVSLRLAYDEIDLKETA